MGQTAFVLLAEPDSQKGQALAQALRRSPPEFRLVSSLVDNGVEAVGSLRVRAPDVVVVDLAMKGEVDGATVINETRRRTPQAELIIIARPEDEPRLQHLLKDSSDGREPFECLIEPVTPEVVADVVSKAARQALASREARLVAEQSDRAFDFEGIVGVSESLLRLIKRAKKLAPSKSTVLITGETGTGKELFAQAIHACSPRAGKPFKVLNCAAVSETLLESELFGHVKGAFTGAVADRKGLLHAADGGTMFLDEIGDMPLSMQAKLLRALENGEIIPVGSNDAIHLDVRFVAATNRDLQEQLQKGKFREDLFFRLHAFGALHIPPLRSRPEDIPILVERFIRGSNAENGTRIKSITPEALRKLMRYNWPGNVRELKNIIERMCVEAGGDVLDVADLPENLQGTTEIVPASLPNLAGLTLADVEQMMIISALRRHDGNREKTARELGISIRTLYRKLREYGVT